MNKYLAKKFNKEKVPKIRYKIMNTTWEENLKPDLFGIDGSDKNDSKDCMSSITSTTYNTKLEFEQEMCVEISAENDFGLLCWWDTNKDGFPILTKVACNILCILVPSV